MKTKLLTLALLYTFIFFSACNSVTTTTPDESTNTTTTADSTVFLFATNYSSSGQIYELSLTGTETSLSNTGLQSLGSSAIIKHVNDTLYILHDGNSVISSDNIQIIDTSGTLQTTTQFSVGNGTNPKDIIISGNRAFVTVYNPQAQSDYVDVEGNPADVVEFDLTTGEAVRFWSFTNHLQNDGDLQATAERIVQHGDFLFVAIQDLSSNTFRATAPGLIGVIDIDTNQIIDVITLQGRNPFDMKVSTDGNTLYVLNAALLDENETGYELDETYGGLEVVDLNTFVTTNFFADNLFSGAVQMIETHETGLYIVSSYFDGINFEFGSYIYHCPADFSDVSSDCQVIDNEGADIRAITIDGDYLWVSRRRLNTNSGIREPEVNVIDLNTFETIGEKQSPLVPGMSFTTKN
jgi:hypothetical protein